MKIENFHVQFTNSSNGVFFPGQMLQGIVALTVVETLEMKGIKMKFKGKADVKWSEGSGDNRRHYHGKEKYFSEEFMLTQYSESGDFVLHPGSYQYPVQFMLPANLPSSFEGNHGYVRYKMKAKVDRSWKSDYKVEYPFTVVSILDLNNDPNSLMPHHMQESKMICCLCCATGPVTAVFRIERRGYVPGEAIILNAEIQNSSDRPINSTKVKLILKTKYKAPGSSKYEHRTVAKVAHGPIDPHGSDTWAGDILVIPPLPPSGLLYCSIIDLEYSLCLIADVADTPFDLDVPLSIIIGNVPLRQAMPPPQYYPPPPAEPALYQGDVMKEPPPITQQPGASPDAPPPSYGDCVFGQKNFTRQRSDDNDQTMMYTPQYTYFNYGNQLTANQVNEINE